MPEDFGQALDRQPPSFPLPGEAVPEQVRRQPCVLRIRVLDLRPLAGVVHDEVQRVDRHLLLAVGREEGTGLPLADKKPQVGAKLFGHRDGAGLGALADTDVHAPFLELDVADVQVGELLAADSGLCEHLHDATVPDRSRGVQDLGDFGLFQEELAVLVLVFAGLLNVLLGSVQFLPHAVFLHPG